MFTCKTTFPHSPVIRNELQELIERMLDKSPEIRITVPEIKVSGGENKSCIRRTYAVSQLV